MPTIRVDTTVYKELQKLATPFVDTPNSVIRKILGLDDDSSGPSSSRGAKSRVRTAGKSNPQRSRKKRERAAVGDMLAEQEYEMPLLTILSERGGSGRASDVVEELGRRLDSQLTETDRALLSSGHVRWKSRAQFVRLRLVERGELAKGSPRGVWELTAAGKRRVQGAR